MSTKNSYMPRPWIRPACYVGQTWEGWLVFLSRTRDSGLLDNHNFETALEALRDVARTDAEEATVRVVRESHWACGWVEWIAIHPSDSKAVERAEELARQLDAYPLLDEHRFSDREYEAMEESWADLSVRDRYELIKRSGNCSIFAARRDYLPDDDRIHEIVSGWL